MILSFSDKVNLLWHRSYQPSQRPALTGSGSLLLSVIILKSTDLQYLPWKLMARLGSALILTAGDMIKMVRDKV